jgi:serine/threonine-protein kinase
VNHPNVVQLFDFGETEEGVPYLVLEALTGETLYEYLVRNKSMTVGEALPLVRQVAEALAAVHQAGLVHGDVKPHNLFLCGDRDTPQCVKLIDFGFAQLLSADTSNNGDTVTGTLEYMAPEQILSDPIDARSDIYSLGIVLFRWLTGELPFGTGPVMGLLGHHLSSVAPPPSWLMDDLNPGLEKLILTAMRKDPENRYQSMTEVLRDIDCVIAGMTDVHGAPLLHKPDEYRPRSEQAQRAYQVIHRSGVFEKPEPLGEKREGTRVAEG